MLITPVFAEKTVEDLKEIFKTDVFITASQIREISYRFIEPLLELLEMNLADFKNWTPILKDLLTLLSEEIPLESNNLEIGLGEEATPDLFLQEKMGEILNKYKREVNPEVSEAELFHLQKIIYPIVYKLLHEYRLNKNPNRPDIDDLNMLRIYHNLPTIDKEKCLSQRLTRLEGDKNFPRGSEISYVVRVLFILKSERIEILENSDKLTVDTKDDPLITAVKYGFTDLVESLVVTKKANPNLTFEGISLLGMACLQQDYAMASILLKNGAVGDNEIKLGDHKTTPFDIACAKGDIKIVVEMMKTITNFAKKTSDDNTALALAVDNNQVAVVQRLTSDPRAKEILDEADQGGMTPLVRAAVKKHREIVSLLLTAGANASFSLFLVCRGGNLTILNTLLEHPNIREKINDLYQGFSSLMIACMFGKISIARTLVTAGADLAAIGSDILMIASEKNNVPLMEFLLAEENIRRIINQPLSTGFTPLTFAAANGYLKLVELLIKADAVLTQKDANGYTPLKAATEMGQVQVVYFLKNAEKNNKSHSGINFAYKPAHHYTATDIPALNVAGIAAYREKSFEKAIDVFTIVVNLFKKHYPENDTEVKMKLAAVLFNLGSAELQLKRTSEALSHLREAADTCIPENKAKYKQRLQECEKTLDSLAL